MINLMIADDDIDITQELSSMLTKEKDFNVINISHDGVEAIANYNALRPDVLLLDLEMPKCSGIEVLEKIQNTNNNRNVIIISGSTPWRSQVQNASQFDWMLQKPVDYPKLFQLIRTIKKEDQYEEIKKKLDSIFEDLLFDSNDKNAKLLQDAILIAYERPNVQLDEIMRIVASNNKKANYKALQSAVSRFVNNSIKRHDNLDEFTKILPRVFVYKPTAKNFILFMARHLEKIY